ncbi:MAG: DUF3493 domain-containing protein [Cyanobacteria bacterium P01_D01_bin.73]
MANRKSLDQETYNRLRREAVAPYRGLRKFVYGGFAASGAIGGFVFFFKVLAGQDLARNVPNLALQVGVVAAMIFLFRWENRVEQKDEQKRQQMERAQREKARQEQEAQQEIPINGE